MRYGLRVIVIWDTDRNAERIARFQAEIKQRVVAVLLAGGATDRNSGEHHVHYVPPESRAAWCSSRCSWEQLERQLSALQDGSRTSRFPLCRSGTSRLRSRTVPARISQRARIWFVVERVRSGAMALSWMPMARRREITKSPETEPGSTIYTIPRSGVVSRAGTRSHRNKHRERACTLGLCRLDFE